MLGFLFTSAALAAAIISTTSAQNFPNQSAPYNLKLSSAETALDGKFLWACHSGAAMEQLCISDTPSDLTGIFFLNTTSIGSTVSGFLTGALVYNLPYGDEDDKQIASSALRFAWNPVSNIIFNYFQPGDEGSEIASVGLDADNKLFVPAYVDDVITPNGPEIFYQWQVCHTQFMGYKYQALVWLTVGNPLDGDCQAVNVTAVPASGA
ncbi:cell wall protein RHD3 [Cladorrhinum samala]|uniref:Cell wall protein RHD3 n=1 Tax=Cladorrhinum samala TaxID=585594 RepID=A0AAV9HVI0_9PEZI|nr:cell wall protein RHD3 [Cladorrhinum samala]